MAADSFPRHPAVGGLEVVGPGPGDGAQEMGPVAWQRSDRPLTLARADTNIEASRAQKSSEVFVSY